jgi:hypothetical protein
MHILKTIVAIFGATLILAGCSPKATSGGGTTNPNPNPVPPGQAQKIHLVWHKAGEYWKVKLNDGGEEDPQTAETKIDKGVGPTMFEVDIQGAGSNNINFESDGGLSVWEGDKSAPKSGINSTQILGPIIDKHGNLIFWDLNQGAPVKLSYSIQFENGVPSVDPIIDNGGGN